MPRRSPVRAARALRPALGALAALALALGACERRPGPQPIVYDREPCAHCRMLISDPHFAAQLEEADGTTRSFDDPGCLLAYLAASGAEARALWFHHVREDRWLAGDATGFEPVPHTPMGYGLGAVDAGREGALGLDEARRRVAQAEGRPAPRSAP